MRDAVLQLGALSMNGDGAVLEGSPSVPTSNVQLAHCSVMQQNQNSLVFASPQAGGAV